MVCAAAQTASTCLADLCDVLHCDWFAATAAAALSASRSPAGRRRPAPPLPTSRMMRDEHCMPHEAARTRTACQELAHA